MGCDEYREDWELITSLEESPELLRPAVEHLKTCEKCAEEFSSVRDLDKLIGEKMAEIETPPFLRERVKANLPGHSSPTGKFPVQWAYVMAGLLLFLSLLFYNQVKMMTRLEELSRSVPKNKTARAATGGESLTASHNAILQLVGIHAVKRHRNILNSKFVVFDNNRINDTFRGKFNFNMLIPEFSRDMRMVGGSKCHSCNYEMAYLLYRQGRNSISLCIFPAREFGLDYWDGQFHTLRSGENNVALWKKQNNVYALVFGIPVNKARNLVWDLQEE